MIRTRTYFWLNVLSFLVFFPLVSHHGESRSQDALPLPTWTHYSTSIGDLDVPGESVEQTATLVLDIDRDQKNDFVISSRRAPGPSLVWYQRGADGWLRHVIDDTVLPIEAGGTYHDIDGDGDMDIVMGADARGNVVWWWENPYPDYTAGVNWTRRLVKDGGAYKHHDQMFADVDNDGAAELVFWNQYGSDLVVAEIPADPHITEPWSQQVIYEWQGGIEHEGLSHGDIDGDGTTDIVGGGRWFKRNGDGSYTPHIIDDGKRFSRAAVGQFVAGGPPEVVFVCGDCDGPLDWYEWDGGNWVSHRLLNVDVQHGHSLEIADINRDGNLDIFNAEMRLNGGNADAATRIFYGDGNGNFTLDLVATGIGNHESTIGDLDGDGDLDILGKPFNWDTPRLDIWLNEQAAATCVTSLTNWQRHVIDDDRPWRAIFVTTADLDGDQDPDLISGGWWYENPGNASGSWTRHTIGEPLNNMAAVYDFDGDGAIDIIGTGGKGSSANAEFVWAHNDGAGNFTILDNIAATSGTFLQGAAVAHLPPSMELQLAVSWHQESQGIRVLTVPTNPLTAEWPWRQISPRSQGEALTSHDLDRDGKLDLLLGTEWLRNESVAATEAWQPYTLHDEGDVDRNRVADLNGDGRVDAIVGYEAANVPGKLAWYAQPLDATQPWTEHLIGEPVGPMSLDVQDMDDDGDWDVVVGEHNMADAANAALWVYENLDGVGGTWQANLVYRGDEHHDGAQTIDVDGDGDLDIVSIGWSHGRVLLYENLMTTCATTTATPTVTATATPTVSPSSTNTPVNSVTATALATVTSSPIGLPSTTPTATSVPLSATPTLTLTPTTASEPVGRAEQSIFLPLVSD